MFVLFLQILRYTTMMKRLGLLFGFVFLFSAFVADDELVKTDIDNQVSMKIPANFAVIPDEALVSYYGFYRFPLAAYSGPSGQENLFVNKTAFLWGGEPDLKVLSKFYKSSVMNSFYKTTFLSDTIITINKRDFIAFEYIGEVGKDVGMLEVDTTGREDNKYNKFSRTGKTYYSYRLYTFAKDKAKEEKDENKDKDDRKKIENEREKQKVVRTRAGEGSVLPNPQQDEKIKRINKAKREMDKDQVKIFIFDFSCPESMKDEWRDKAMEMMESIKIK